MAQPKGKQPPIQIESRTGDTEGVVLSNSKKAEPTRPARELQVNGKIMKIDDRGNLIFAAKTDKGASKQTEGVAPTTTVVAVESGHQRRKRRKQEILLAKNGNNGDSAKEALEATQDAEREDAKAAARKAAAAAAAAAAELNQDASLDRASDAKADSKRKALPIWNSRKAIRAALRDHDVLVLSGDTGSGKSTQLPQFLYDEPWCTRAIAVTQPRRIAAVSLAHRVAQEMGRPLRKEGASSSAAAPNLVGYAVRFDRKAPRGCKIIYMTVGMLLQEMLRDRNLKRYSMVVVDEVHERSADIDMLLAFLRRLVAFPERRLPFKVVIMSATAHVDKFQSFFMARFTALVGEKAAYPPASVEVLNIPGRQFPVEISYLPQPTGNLSITVAETVLKVNAQEPFPGNILVFLAGQNRIENCYALLKDAIRTLPAGVPAVELCTLFGRQELDDQGAAFLPAKTRFTRKVILATNIAETSLTVPGVRYVVDGGKAKAWARSRELDMERLAEMEITKSSAIQRAGRAGREAKGKCFRMYTEDMFQQFFDDEIPEILRCNVLDIGLTLAGYGIVNPYSFPMVDKPSGPDTKSASEFLQILGALDVQGKISEVGKVMAKLPLPAMYGRVLIEAAHRGCLVEAIDVISFLTTNEEMFGRPVPAPSASQERAAGADGEDAAAAAAEEELELMAARREELVRREGDLLTYLTAMQRFLPERKQHRKTWCRDRGISYHSMEQAVKTRRQLREMCRRLPWLSQYHTEWDYENDVSGRRRNSYLPVSPERAQTLLHCFVRAFFLKTARLDAHTDRYYTLRDRKEVAIHPSSTLFGRRKPETIMFLDQVYTSKRLVRRVSAVEASWVLELDESTRPKAVEAEAVG